MRPTRYVTTLLFLAAITAGGCSKRDDAAKKPADPVSPPAKTVDSVPQPPVVKTMDSEGYTTTTEKAPFNPAVSFADGEAAYREKKYGDAVAIFEHYTDSHPKNAWGYYMLGLSAWKAGDLAKAEKAFGQSLAIDPKHGKSLVNLSRVFIDGKKFDEAVVTLTKAGDLDPESADVHRLLGRAYEGQKNTDAAEESYRRAIDLDDRDAWSMNNLGFLLIEDGRADEAVPLLTKAVELRKDIAIFNNNLGMALEHTGQFKAAAAAYKDAVAADSGYEKARQNFARVDAVKKDREKPFTVDTTARK